MERLPIPDFRAPDHDRLRRPTADLLDTIYLCQQRQEWFREYARNEALPPLALVGSARLQDSVEATATRLRTALAFDLSVRRELPTWTDALRRFLGQVEDLGVLIMVAGVVGSNNRRKLDPAEFRGFALSDPLAPLIFINGSDSKAAQMFTLAHELAHLALGQSALSDTQPSQVAANGNLDNNILPEARTESWCNRVAAELLVPIAAFLTEYRQNAECQTEAQRLARIFKVSVLVILRRMYEAGGLTRNEFSQEYQAALDRLATLPGGSGGDFYLTLGARVGKRFSRAVVSSTLEGRSSFSDAFRLLGFRKMSTFRALSRTLGMSF